MTTLDRGNGTNDIFINEDGKLAMSDGLKAKRQIIEAAVLTVRGELQLDLENGIPYFDTIFDNPKKANLWKAYVMNRVRKFPWVAEISDFNYTINFRQHTLSYKMTVLTTQDETIIVEATI